MRNLSPGPRLNSTLNLHDWFSRLLEIFVPDGGYVVAFYEAYMDESYEMDKPPHFVVIGAYIMRVDTASLLDEKWRAILAHHEVDHFHMSQVAAHKGDFRKLGENGCIALQTDIINLLAQMPIFGISLFISIDRPWSFVSFGDSPSHDLYADAVKQCAQQLCSQVRSFDPNAKVTFFLESGHPSEAIALAALRTMEGIHPNYLTCMPVDKKIVPLVQTADVIAWQTARFLKNKIAAPHVKPRGDFKALIESRPYGWFFFYRSGGIPEFFFALGSEQLLKYPNRWWQKVMAVGPDPPFIIMLPDNARLKLTYSFEGRTSNQLFWGDPARTPCRYFLIRVPVKPQPPK